MNSCWVIWLDMARKSFVTHSILIECYFGGSSRRATGFLSYWCHQTQSREVCLVSTASFKKSSLNNFEYICPNLPWHCSTCHFVLYLHSFAGSCWYVDCLVCRHLNCWPLVWSTVRMSSSAFSMVSWVPRKVLWAFRPLWTFAFLTLLSFLPSLLLSSCPFLRGLLMG